MIAAELVDAARAERRVWRYRYGTWAPRWWQWILPAVYRGGDEFGRHTLIVHVPAVGFVVWAFWTCRCDECDESRVERYSWCRTCGGPCRDESDGGAA